MTLLVSVLTGCEKTPELPPVADLTISYAVVENSIEFTVSSSEPDQVYTVGLLTGEELEGIGGKDGLASYVSNLIATASPLELFSGDAVVKYEDLQWFGTYYAFAAQINENALYGEPVLSDAVTLVKSYIEFSTESPICPASISDNGRYVVGNFVEDSYVYDLFTDELVIVEGATLYDITDDGVAYGNGSSNMPVKYENGEIVDIQAPAVAQEACIMSITPDGSKGVGYMANEMYMFVPIVYQNGTISEMALGVGPEGTQAIGGAGKGIASNGVAAGYLITSDYLEVSAVWDAAGNCEAIGNDYAHFDEEYYFWDIVYGNMFTYISPNGKYVSAIRTVPGDTPWNQSYLPFLYDVETGEMNSVTEEECNGYNVMRVDAVSSDGLVFLSDTDMGFSSIPYVYSAGNGVEPLQDYVERTYGVTLEADMNGTVIATSYDGKKMVLGNINMTDGTYKTMIYCF